MTVLDPEIVEAVNQFGKIGILATADAKGQPNEAWRVFCRMVRFP